MARGKGQCCPSGCNDGRWFAHSSLPRTETRNRETSTTTGVMLSQVKASLPQACSFERYPKWKTKQITIEYPFSHHDNKRAFKGDIIVFSHGVRRRQFDDRREYDSNFGLDHESANSRPDETKTYNSAYKSDFEAHQGVSVPTRNRRFPRNHLKKCTEAALEQAGEKFMWFGRSDFETPQVLPAPNHTSIFRPLE